jgi:hypothetical protein
MIILTLKYMRNVNGNTEPENISLNDKTNQACIKLSEFQPNVNQSAVKQHQQYCFYNKYLCHTEQILWARLSGVQFLAGERNLYHPKNVQMGSRSTQLPIQ